MKISFVNFYFASFSHVKATGPPLLVYCIIRRIRNGKSVRQSSRQSTPKREMKTEGWKNTEEREKKKLGSQEIVVSSIRKDGWLQQQQLEIYY